MRRASLCSGEAIAACEIVGNARYGWPSEVKDRRTWRRRAGKLFARDDAARPSCRLAMSQSIARAWHGATADMSNLRIGTPVSRGSITSAPACATL